MLIAMWLKDRRTRRGVRVTTPCDSMDHARKAAEALGYTVKTIREVPETPKGYRYVYDLEDWDY